MDNVLRVGIGGEVSTYYYSQTGAVVTPPQLSDAFAAVFSPEGTQLSATREVVPSSDGCMTVDVNAWAARHEGDYFRVRFTFTAESAERVKDIYFHVAQAPFDIPVNYEDLLRLEPDYVNVPFLGDDCFEQFRLAARDELFYRLKAGGCRPWRLLNDDDLRPCALYLWASYIFRAFSKSSADFSSRADHYRELFEHIFARSEFLEEEVG